MSLQRTPPMSANRQIVSNTDVASYESDPELNVSQYENNSSQKNAVSRRVKPKHFDVNSPENTSLLEQVRDLFAAFEAKQNVRFEKLLDTVNTIKDQYTESKKCINFLSSKYDEFLNKINTLE